MTYDLVKEANCGIVADEQTIDSVKGALYKLIRLQKDEYELMCENSLRAAEKYDFKAQTGKLNEVFRFATKQKKERNDLI